MSRKGIDTGRQGRAVLTAQSWKFNSKIFKSGKKKCSRCNKVKKLSEFRPIPKKQQNKPGIVIYVSHCNRCDAKRTAKFKSKKGSTIEGSAYFLMSNVKRRSKDKKGLDYEIINFCNYVNTYFKIKKKYNLSFENNDSNLFNKCSIKLKN